MVCAPVMRTGAAWRRKRRRERHRLRFGGGEHNIGGRSSREVREGVWRSEAASVAPN